MFMMKKVIYRSMPVLIFIPSPVNDNLSEWEDIDSQETRDFLQAMYPEWYSMIYQTADEACKYVNVGLSAEDIRTIIKGYGG